MRLGRIGFILFTIYLMFLGGSAYYSLVFPIRQLHHTLLTLVMAVWLIFQLRRGGLPQTPLNWPIAAAVVVWFLSAFMSIDRRMAFENLWFVLMHILFFYALTDLFRRGRQRMVMDALFMVSAVVILMSAVELASWYFGLGIIPNTQIGWFNVIGTGAWLPLTPIRLSLAMNISTLLAGFVAPIVTITAVWALTTWKKPFSRVLWVLSGLLLIVLILTFSRGGLLSILTAVGTMGVLQFAQLKRVTNRVPARLILGSAVFIGIIIVAGYVIYSITQSRSTNSGDAGRLDMWRSAAAITRDYPITGVGVGIYGRAFRTYRDPTIVQDKLASAHNAYLNTAAETGIPGILVSIWLGIVIIRTWYKNWKTTESPARKLRLAGAFGALLGLGVHSMVDVFTITPIVLIIVGLAAYCITPTDMVYEGQRDFSTTTQRRKLITYAALAVVIVYGIWFIQLDRAQTHYLNSFNESENPATDAQNAAAIDSGLSLYPLQTAYLNDKGGSSTTIDDYKAALELEPTWDIGWINLATRTLQQGDTQAALDYLDKARKINAHNPASLFWAHLAEETNSAPNDEIITAYIRAIEGGSSLPLSSFWYATDLRKQAIHEYLMTQPLDIQYRVLSIHDAARTAELIPQSPSTSADWWVTGEYALTVSGQPEVAVQNFSEAIRLSPANGDYYVSRARATYQNDPTSAQRDLQIAALLGTINEFPNVLLAKLTTIPAERELLLAQALPNKAVPQEFAAVLYNRPAIFQISSLMQGIGPGHTVMQPWYTLADERLKVGNLEGAIRVYRAILEYAPDETEAAERLAQLSS
ncbi:MAG: O-antigen ligase family protein [Chloroflexi bacterium]|nr:O-antigen ligase family protein [Chloroflexota bacterium]MCC6895140.1 O-antigen ligase family protein [Anaerolineae bacterium]